MFLIVMNSFVNMSLNILFKLHLDGGGKFELQKNKQKLVDDHEEARAEKIFKPNQISIEIGK